MSIKSKQKEILNNALNGIKLHNAGVKRKRFSNRPVCSSPVKMNYPSLYLNAKQAPELTGYEVDDEVVLVVKGKIMSHSKNDEIGRTHESFDIEIKQIGCKVKEK